MLKHFWSYSNSSLKLKSCIHLYPVFYSIHFLQHFVKLCVSVSGSHLWQIWPRYHLTFAVSERAERYGDHFASVSISKNIGNSFVKRTLFNIPQNNEQIWKIIEWITAKIKIIYWLVHKSDGIMQNQGVERWLQTLFGKISCSKQETLVQK